MIGHYMNKPACKVPKDQVRCYICGAMHDARDHDWACPKQHKVAGKCDCRFRCLLCGKTGHHARAKACPMIGNFAPPRLASGPRPDHISAPTTSNDTPDPAPTRQCARRWTRSPAKRIQ